MRTYKLSTNAKEDLRRLYSYGLAHFGEANVGAVQADRYFYGFFETFERIAKHPHQFQQVDELRTGYFRCVHKSDTIYFRITNEAVEIMAILGGQDIDEWL